ncbi:hypothetical protein [Streptomyces doebereineriae]|uniref:Uncharacterized protein n=1 Tax=Streptomyces doebereineriae TaxID=3075528 RepID=A0ABU2VJ35_9ACTN|nr:hypothetical protein [Streptomyces sp. DSM 41640]MDT0485275.1 hypothetical protein [Streptomyces sp. DSM 41640]
MSLDAAVAPQPASPHVPARWAVETDPRLYIGQRSSDPQRDVDQLLRWAAALRSEQLRAVSGTTEVDWTMPLAVHVGGRVVTASAARSRSGDLPGRWQGTAFERSR